MLYSILAMTLALSAQTPPSSGLRFIPTASCRITDVFVGKDQTLTIPMRIFGCYTPLNAKAYSIRVMATPVTQLGFLTVYPTGQPRPNSSMLNSWDGRVVSNAVFVETGTNGNINVYASDPTLIHVEINGHFVARETPAALSYYTVQPCRLADTRNEARIAVIGPLERSFAVRGQCDVPEDAVAYSVNLTVIPDGPDTLQTKLYPTGHVRPVSNTVAAQHRQVAASAAIVPGGNDGKVSVFGDLGHNVVLDVNGYFAPTGQLNALMYRPVNPCRIADTRSGAPLGTGDSRVFAVRGTCEVPQDARAFAFNVTAVPPGPLGFVTFWPAFFPQPLVSTLNAYTGQVTANMALIPAGLNGSIAAYSSNPTHLVLDINGFFVNDRPAAPGN